MSDEKKLTALKNFNDGGVTPTKWAAARIEALEARAEAAEARVARLTEALEFYADRRAYQPSPYADDKTAGYDVLYDEGATARAALSEDGGEDG